MKKKLLACILCVSLTASLLIGCGSGSKTEEPSETNEEENALYPNKNPDGPTIGLVMYGDDSEGYTENMISGIKEAMDELGLTDNDVKWFYNVGEDEKCYDTCVDCINSGCKMVICTAYGHESFARQVAEEYPDIEVCNLTGDTAKASGLENFHNSFPAIYEARYVGGVVAGLKLQELIEDNKLASENYDENGNVKVGYVGAYPYAEVVSGYTAWYLGIKSIIENVVMDVSYTNSWSSITAENEAAIALIEQGCCMISQHADTTGAPQVCEEKLTSGSTVYNVGYNIDFRSVAPTAALTSAKMLWKGVYLYYMESILNGEKFDTNYTLGYADDGVMITELGDSCAEGTQEVVDEVIASIIDGSLHVFDTKTFTVDGKEVKEAFATDTDGDWVNDADNAVFDGYYHESYFQSAPSFSLRIDGITELNAGN